MTKTEIIDVNYDERLREWRVVSTGQGTRELGTYDTKMSAMGQAKNIAEEEHRFGVVVTRQRDGSIYDVWWPESHRRIKVEPVTERRLEKMHRKGQFDASEAPVWGVYRRRDGSRYSLIDAHKTQSAASEAATEEAEEANVRKVVITDENRRKQREWLHPLERHWR